MIPSIIKAVTDTPALLADIQANPLDPAVYGKLAEAVRRNDEAAGILLRALAESSGLLPLTRDGVDNRIRIETSESLLRGRPRDVQSNAPLILWNGWPRGVEFEALDQFRMGVHGAFSRWPLQHLGIDFSRCEVDDLNMLDAEFIRLGELKKVTSLSFILPPDKVLNTDTGFSMFVKVCKELFRDSWHLTNLQRLCMVNPVGNIFGVDRILDALQGPKLLKQLRAGWFQLRGNAPGIDAFFSPAVLPLCTDLTLVGCDVPVPKYGQTAPLERSVVDVYAALPIAKQITRLRFIGCDVSAARLTEIQKAAGVGGLERFSVFANRAQLDLSGVTRNIFGKLRHLAVVGTPIANAQALQTGGLFAGLESLELSQCGLPLRYWRGDLREQQQWCKEGRESVVQLLKLCEKHPQKRHHYPLKALNLSGCGPAMPQIAEALVANKSLGNLLLLGLDGLELSDVRRLTAVVKNRTLDCVRALTAMLVYDDGGETPNLDEKLEEAVADHHSITWARVFGEPFVGDMGFEPFYAGTWFGNQYPPTRWFAGSDLP